MWGFGSIPKLGIKLITKKEGAMAGVEKENIASLMDKVKLALEFIAEKKAIINPSRPIHIITFQKCKEQPLSDLVL